MSTIPVEPPIETTIVKASCHCKKNTFTINLPTHTLPISSDLCHCIACQRVTGSLFVGYLHVPHDLVPDVNVLPPHLKEYRSSKEASRYFCDTCGAHIAFHGHGQWYIATGLLDKVEGIVTIGWHQFVQVTKDGGVSNLLHDGLPRYSEWGAENGGTLWEGKLLKGKAYPNASSNLDDTLKAHCHCKNVTITLSSPKSQEIGKGAERCLRVNDKSKFPASHCCCPSCRTTSGFTITSWAFVPHSHTKVDLDQLERYKSSEDVTRYFCGTCGANVFYYVADRPAMWDLALGLVETGEEGVLTTLERWFEFKDSGRTEGVLDVELSNVLMKGLVERYAQ